MIQFFSDQISIKLKGFIFLYALYVLTAFILYVLFIANIYIGISLF
jgi:hypothetical protein